MVIRLSKCGSLHGGGIAAVAEAQTHVTAKTLYLACQRMLEEIAAVAENALIMSYYCHAIRLYKG